MSTPSSAKVAQLLEANKARIEAMRVQTLAREASRVQILGETLEQVLQSLATVPIVETELEEYAHALSQFVQSKETIRMLREKLLRHPQPIVRQMALLTLRATAWRRGEEVIDDFLHGLEDSYVHNRIEALQGLADTGSDRADVVEAIEDLIQDWEATNSESDEATLGPVELAGLKATVILSRIENRMTQLPELAQRLSYPDEGVSIATPASWKTAEHPEKIFYAHEDRHKTALTLQIVAAPIELEMTLDEYVNYQIAVHDTLGDWQNVKIETAKTADGIPFILMEVRVHGDGRESIQMKTFRHHRDHFLHVTTSAPVLWYPVWEKVYRKMHESLRSDF